MSWIKTVAPEEATGLLKKLYDDAVRRAGKVFNILRIQSRHPRVLRISTQLYSELMFSPALQTQKDRRHLVVPAPA